MSLWTADNVRRSHRQHSVEDLVRQGSILDLVTQRCRVEQSVRLVVDKPYVEIGQMEFVVQRQFGAVAESLGQKVASNSIRACGVCMRAFTRALLALLACSPRSMRCAFPLTDATLGARLGTFHECIGRVRLAYKEDESGDAGVAFGFWRQTRGWKVEEAS